MVSLFALYRRPQDEAVFLDHYQSVHVPLARRMPGLLTLDWGTPASLNTGDGDQDWFLIAEMRFDTKDAMTEALQSSEGRLAGEDVNSFAAGLLTMRTVQWQ